MPSIFDFDLTITRHHTFGRYRIEAMSQKNNYEDGKEHAKGNIKKQAEDYLKHDDNTVSAVATFHNNPDFVAGYIATLIGKELTLEKTTVSDDGLTAVNQYTVAGISKPFLISYIPKTGNEFNQATNYLYNKNTQIEALHQIMLEQQLIQDDSVIDFYEDSERNYNGATKFPYIRSHLVDESDSFNILETKRRLPLKTTAVKPEDDQDKLTEFQQAIARAQEKYAAYHKDGSFKRWDTAGLFSFFRHGSAGQAKAVQIGEQIGQCQNLNDALDYLDSHLTNSNTRYYRHSFASYLLDEVSSFANNHFEDKQLIQCNANKHYQVGDWTKVLPQLKTLMAEQIHMSGLDTK